MKKFARALFIFRRDLRLSDNTALAAAAHEAEEVVPCFIFDPRQYEEENSYRSLPGLQFLIESLNDLEESISSLKGKLYYGDGKAEEVIPALALHLDCDAIFFNKDYTPFSKNRDLKISKAAASKDIMCHSYDDALLIAPDKATKIDATPYTVFTPFYKKMSQIHIPLPHRTPSIKWHVLTTIPRFISTSKPKNLSSLFNDNLCIQGGRTKGKQLLKKALDEQHTYLKTRDLMAESTTKLSAHLKFGTLSIREVYHSFTKHFTPGHGLIRQLYWRDFFTDIAYHFPHVFGHSFNTKYEAVRWSHNKTAFERWCSGTTGFPIVDAAMRELNTTGFMHNRGRMIVASFLTKDLHIDWRWGEQYFATKLIDYDPAVNNGSWQWAASTGCDAQPYFRIFNPWLQQKKFDPSAQYIKQWVKELENEKPDVIHNGYQGSKINSKYPLPMVEHSVESKIAIERFKLK